jgi:hypothetical protein
VIERAPLRPGVDVALLDDEPAVLTDNLSAIRTLDEIVRPTLRTVADTLGFLLFGFRFALSLLLAAGPCHRIFILVGANILNPW